MIRRSWLAMALLVSMICGVFGCAGVGPQSPPGEVKAYFVAAQEANLQGFQSLSSRSPDLSAYNHLVGVKYPPTQTVEVLTAPPSRPYQAFAVLESPLSASDTGPVEELKDKAREIGADAIILRQAGQGLPGLPLCRKTGALAIKYRLEIYPGEAKRF